MEIEDLLKDAAEWRRNERGAFHDTQAVQNPGHARASAVTMRMAFVLR